MRNKNIISYSSVGIYLQVVKSQPIVKLNIETKNKFTLDTKLWNENFNKFVVVKETGVKNEK